MSAQKTYYRDGFVALKNTDDYDKKIWWVWRPGETLHGRQVHVLRQRGTGWKAHVLAANGAERPLEELDATPTLMSAAAAYASALTWIRKEWRKLELEKAGAPAV